MNGDNSKWFSVFSEVPQGSVLHSLLFFLYVNNIPDLVHSKIKNFADDIKIYTTKTSFMEAVTL